MFVITRRRRYSIFHAQLICQIPLPYAGSRRPRMPGQYGAAIFGYGLADCDGAG